MSTATQKSIPTWAEVCHAFAPECTGVLALYKNDLFTDKVQEQLIQIPLSQKEYDFIHYNEFFEITASSGYSSSFNNISFHFHGFVYNDYIHYFIGIIHSANSYAVTEMCIQIKNITNTVFEMVIATEKPAPMGMVDIIVRVLANV